MILKTKNSHLNLYLALLWYPRQTFQSLWELSRDFSELSWVGLGLDIGLLSPIISQYKVFLFIKILIIINNVAIKMQRTTCQIKLNTYSTFCLFKAYLLQDVKLGDDQNFS